MTVDDHSVITCHVEGYYPDIILQFLQKGKRIQEQTYTETTNEDGTRKKTVAITAIVSSDLYECVASNVPGLDKHTEKSAYILLTSSDKSVTQEPGGILSPGTLSTETEFKEIITYVNKSIIFWLFKKPFQMFYL